jgi:hypothetical protein
MTVVTDWERRTILGSLAKQERSKALALEAMGTALDETGFLPNPIRRAFAAEAKAQCSEAIQPFL